MDDVLSLVTNVGFPVAISFVLLRYVLHTMEEKLEKIHSSISHLIEITQDSASSQQSKHDS
ncbi:YvrJ family protein [Paenibacillus pini]|nr:YvrJ family protein [Paenibacillus pini]